MRPQPQCQEIEQGKQCEYAAQPDELFCPKHLVRFDAPSSCLNPYKGERFGEMKVIRGALPGGLFGKETL